MAGKLPRAKIHLRQLLPVELLPGHIRAHMGNDAHDGERRRLLVVRLVIVEVLSNRILIGEIAGRQRVIDDDRARLLWPVFGTKGAPAQDRHLENFEIIGRDHVYFRRGLLPGRRRWRSSDVEGTVPLRVVEGHIFAD